MAASPHSELGQYYAENRRELLVYAISLCGTREEAEDAIQDGFRNLLKRGMPMIGSDITRHAYIFRAVRNAALDRARSSQRREKLFHGLTEEIRDAPEPDDSSPRRAAMLSDLNRAVDSLDAQQREAIILHLRCGLSFREIGEMLDLPIATVASRYRRGLTKLRESLSGQTRIPSPKQ